MQILLVYPNANKDVLMWGDIGALAEPISLEYIGAAAKKDGHTVTILDLRLHNEKLEDTLLRLQPDVVGVTGYSMHVNRCLTICSIAKQLVPSCKTVVGGHHATVEPVDFLEKQIDFIVCGEGTQSFREILKGLENGASCMKIPGVYSRINGEWEYVGKQLAFNIDDMPNPDRTIIQQDRTRYYIDWMKPLALIRTSVGCPYRCSFCSLWRIMDGKHYKRDIDAVIAELKTISEKNIFFVDDEPFVNPRRMRILAEKIKKEGIEKNYLLYCRIDSMIKHKDVMKQWKEIGLSRLIIGIESIFDSELDDYNKKYHRDKIVKGLQIASALGIRLLSNFIIHPNYTENDFNELIRFIKENNIEHPSFTIFTPLPGTGCSYNNIKIIKQNGRPDWDYFDLQHPVIETRLSKEEFMKQYTNLYITFAYKYSISNIYATAAIAFEQMKNPLKKN